MYTLSAFGRKYQVSKSVFAWMFPIAFVAMISIVIMTMYAIYASCVAIGSALGVHWGFILVGTFLTFFPLKIEINGKSHSTSIIGDNEHVNSILTILFFASALYIGVSTAVTVFIVIWFLNMLITRINKMI